MDANLATGVHVNVDAHAEPVVRAVLDEVVPGQPYNI